MFQCYMLMTGKGRVIIHRDQIRLNWGVLVRLLRVSITGIIQFVIATASWLGLVRMTSVFGTAAVAGYTIAIRIVIFIILPSWGMCNAAATLVGQSLGAGKPERAESAVWRAGRYNMLYLGLVSIVLIGFPEAIVGFFTTDAGALSMGADCLRIVSYGNLFYAWGMVMVQAFNGAGDTLTPTLINLGCYWLFQLPLAYMLAIRLGMGPRGVFAAIPIAETALAVVSLIVFRRGKWKQQKM
jgi:Na+-driven multidrug efflux pump